MKKILLLIFILVLIFTLSSCKIGTDEKPIVVETSGSSVAYVDYSMYCNDGWRVTIQRELVWQYQGADIEDFRVYENGTIEYFDNRIGTIFVVKDYAWFRWDLN